MQIVEFGAGTLRYLDQVPAGPPERGFVWVYLERETLDADLQQLQQACTALGGSPLLDLHLTDLANPQHPSSYDYTSVYDILVFRRLASEVEVRMELGEEHAPQPAPLATFGHIRTRAVGFVAFDRLLVSVHPQGCLAARSFIERHLADALRAETLSAAVRSRLPTSPADLMLRMLNMMVDSYLDLRRRLSGEMDSWQQQLLAPRARTAADWGALLTARNAIHTLEDLSEGQHDAVQEWLDTQHEQPAPWLPQAERDSLEARARDVVEHIQRVLHHAHRMEQNAETAVQIHFSAQANRTNEIMRVLTALTAVFLPLNFMTGFFGMNFEYLPLIHSDNAMWFILGFMVFVSAVVIAVFWRKRYLARTGG